jgi:hypothetical protein
MGFQVSLFLPPARWVGRKVFTVGIEGQVRWRECVEDGTSGRPGQELLNRVRKEEEKRRCSITPVWSAIIRCSRRGSRSSFWAFDESGGSHGRPRATKRGAWHTARSIASGTQIVSQMPSPQRPHTAHIPPSILPPAVVQVSESGGLPNRPGQ